MASQIIAQKFGGTSVATAESRQLVVDHIRRTISEGYMPAVVVSAMGRRGAPYATDTLIDFLHAQGEPVDGRDEDLIFHCGEIISVATMSHLLKLAGLPSIGLTGAQARVHSDGRHRRGKIVHIDPHRILHHLRDGVIPVITGGQGVTEEEGEVNILGRGASDTSGVAIGAAVGAEKVEIYSDVPGVAITDPRIVPRARFLKEMSYRSLYEIGLFGARVVHPGAVLIGQQAGVPIVCRSTFDQSPGTVITDTEDEPPLVGLPVMGPVDLLVLAEQALEGVHTKSDLYDRFEAVMIEAAGGKTVVGVKTVWRPALDESLAQAAVEPEEVWPNQALVSMIGQPKFIEESAAQAQATLADLDIPVSFREQIDIRHSFAVPSHESSRVVQALYGKFAE
jgi:aspartate kinase